MTTGPSLPARPLCRCDERPTHRARRQFVRPAIPPASSPERDSDRLYPHAAAAGSSIRRSAASPRCTPRPIRTDHQRSTAGDVRRYTNAAETTVSIRTGLRRRPRRARRPLPLAWRRSLFEGRLCGGIGVGMTTAPRLPLHLAPFELVRDAVDALVSDPQVSAR